MNIESGSLRFILALTVIFYHITKLVFLGHCAVYCFFILSGYWITLMFENKYSKFLQPLKVFFISRVWRLFPVFLFFNFFGYVCCYFFKYDLFKEISSLQGIDFFLFLFSNIFLIGFNHLKLGILVPAWSLDIEFQFYLIYPMVLLWLKKSFYFMLSVGVLATLIISIFYSQGFFSKTLAFYLTYFLIGMLIYLKNIKFRLSTEKISIAVFFIILMVNYAFPGLHRLTVANNGTVYNAYLNEVLPLLLIPLISNSVKRISSKIDRLLGDTSYVLYLCHWVILIPYNYYIKGLSANNRILYSFIYLVTTLFVSFLIYEFYDKPIDKSRRRWVSAQLMA